uniref:NAD-dependent epimerase/dehydratase domain-containing protein n=1 Tax=Physcomitrium patens TaxID=3218 RepID=A0A2K1K2M4_PHYPA|nr:hypothetical protein PHYPA_012498 [Physcomitrium patens]
MVRLNLDRQEIMPLGICMIGTSGFIGSHFCEKLMEKMKYNILDIVVYGIKIQHVLMLKQS